MTTNIMPYFRIVIICALSLTFVQKAYSAAQMRVNMSAHIIESSIANLKDTQWTLYRSNSISGSDGGSDNNLISTKLQSFKGAIQSLVLPRGQYIIKAQYGDAVKVQAIKVELADPKSFMNLKIVFNLGGLQLSSSLGNKTDVIAKGVKYVIRSVETGKIILETEDISKTYYLLQGEYNITAQLSDVTVTDANVKIIANNMNDVRIRHKVGEVRLNSDNVKSADNLAPATWHIIGAKNNINIDVSSTEPVKPILLPAGDYKLLIETSDFIYSKDFGMHPGQLIEFSVPQQ